MFMSHEIMSLAYNGKTCIDAFDEKLICCDHVIYM